jgi:hypothetical protein
MVIDLHCRVKRFSFVSLEMLKYINLTISYRSVIWSCGGGGGYRDVVINDSVFPE